MRLLTVLIVALLWAVPSHAAIITFTDANGFISQTGLTQVSLLIGPSGVGVENCTPGIFEPCAFELDGVTYTATTGPNFKNRPMIVYSSYLDFQGVGSAAIPKAPGDLSLTFAPTLAVGFDIWTGSAQSQPYAVQVTDILNNTTTYQLALAFSTSPQFFGVIDSTPIASISLWNVGLDGAYSNFAVGNVRYTPEPSSLALLGLGGAMLWRRRKRH